MTSIARSYPEWAGASVAPPPADRAPAAALGRAAPFVRLFAFACFFAYPSLVIGNKNGLQLSQALALLAIPALLMRAPGRCFHALILLLTPLYVSSFINVLSYGAPEAGVLPKESISLTIALIVLWPSVWLATPGRFRDALAMAAAAVAAHALIGLYQVYSFSHDEFPLLFLYRNPSFKSMETWSTIYATYVKRPCGLFPEPSAMAASLGPWLVVLAAQLVESTPGMRLGRMRRGLVGVAVAGGFALLALSRSGSTIPLMAAVLVACLGKVSEHVRAFSAGKLAAVMLVMLAVGGVIGSIAWQMRAGLDVRVEQSWGLRSLSIVTGLTANTEPLSLALGVGPGQSMQVVRKLLAGVPRPKDQDDMAIWSLVVCYYMETGLLGALAMFAVFLMAVTAIGRSSADAVGLAGLFAWIVGVTATTSYMHLSAVWLFLGALLSWDTIFPKRPPAEEPLP